MTDRRLYPRSVFIAPANAQLRSTIDGEIERWDSTSVAVICDCASACGDELVVQVVAGTGETTRWAAMVLACEPVVNRPTTRYRWRLCLTRAHQTTSREAVPTA